MLIKLRARSQSRRQMPATASCRRAFVRVQTRSYCCSLPRRHSLPLRISTHTHTDNGTRSHLLLLLHFLFDCGEGETFVVVAALCFVLFAGSPLFTFCQCACVRERRCARLSVCVCACEGEYKCVLFLLCVVSCCCLLLLFVLVATDFDTLTRVRLFLSVCVLFVIVLLFIFEAVFILRVLYTLSLPHTHRHISY